MLKIEVDYFVRTKKFGGKVFYIYPTKVGKKKEIQNKDVIEDILSEIKKLS